MAINEAKLPHALPADVQRVREGGYPSEELLDNEQLQREWFRKAAVDLDSRVTTLTSSLGDVTGTVEEISNVIENPDGSLTAGKLTSTTVLANNATAEGAIYLAARAGPTGSSAAYGWYVTAGDEYVGMQAIVDSVTGEASLALAAESFRFDDSGTAENVFNYSGGVFTFNVPVSIQNGDIASQAVSQVGASSGATGASVTITARGEGAVIIQALVEGTPLTYTTSTLSGLVEIYSDATLLKQVALNVARDTKYTFSGGGTVTGSFSEFALLHTPVFIIDTPSAGSVTYSVVVGNTTGVAAVSLLVTELSR